MPAPTPFQPINLGQPGAKKLRRHPIKPMQRSFPLPQAPATVPVPELGQAPARRKYNKDELKLDVQYLSQRLTDYLKEGDRFEQLLRESKMKDIAVVMGILTEKLLLLEGQPTQIISNAQHSKIDQIGTRLVEEMKRRGITVTATERKIEMSTPA